jgi:hypothetical protein
VEADLIWLVVALYLLGVVQAVIIQRSAWERGKEDKLFAALVIVYWPLWVVTCLLFAIVGSIFQKATGKEL